MNSSPLAHAAAASVLIAAAAQAAQFIYPAKGQTPAQQANDEAACSTWATQQVERARAAASAGTSGTAPSAGAAGTKASAKVPAIPGGTKTVETAAALLAGSSSKVKGGKSSTATLAAAAAAGMSKQGGGSTGLGDAATLLAGGGGKTSTAAQAAGLASQALAHQAKPKTPSTDFDRARLACLTGRGYSVQYADPNCIRNRRVVKATVFAASASASASARARGALARRPSRSRAPSTRRLWG